MRFAWYSLVLVAKGYALALLIGTPLGFILGWSKLFQKSFDPVIQVLRPVSPLAWLPLGLVLFQKSHPAALFTIAVCAMWPTVLNTALGVRSIPKDYLNVAKVLQLSPWKTFIKVLLPAALPYMFTGYRLSLGIAWLVIVAVEMLTGTPGVGGFLWQEYNSLIYEHIILCILTIGVVGILLDRMMKVVEDRLRVGGVPLTMAVPGARQGQQGLRRGQGPQPGAQRRQPDGERGRVRGGGGLLRRRQDHAHLDGGGLAEAGLAAPSPWTASRSPGPAPSAG